MTGIETSTSPPQVKVKKRPVKLDSTSSFNSKQVVRTSFLGPRRRIFPPPGARFST